MREPIDYQSLARSIEARKQALGLAAIDLAALRNSGERRSEEKRATLRRIDARARERGVEPLPTKI